MAISPLYLQKNSDYMSHLDFTDCGMSYRAEFFWHDRCITVYDLVGNFWNISTFRPESLPGKHVIGEYYIIDRTGKAPTLSMESLKELVAMKTW